MLPLTPFTRPPALAASPIILCADRNATFPVRKIVIDL